MIERLLRDIPAEVLKQSGQALYAGRTAFSRQGPLYLLGANPGGTMTQYLDLTVGKQIDEVLHKHPDRWSAYEEQSRRGSGRGLGLRKGVLHLLKELGLDPKETPASNVCFARSRRPKDVDFKKCAETCWPFHRAVIEFVRPGLIVCLGKDAGQFVCRKLDARTEVCRFVERNRRGWTNLVFENEARIRVAQLTHPARVDWTNPVADPAPMVRRALSQHSRGRSQGDQ